LELEKRHKEIFKIKTEIEILDAKMEANENINKAQGDCG